MAVYVVQEPMRRNFTTGQLEAFMDLTPATAYGEIKILLDRPNYSLTPGPLVNLLKQKLKDFCDDDFLLGVGDPTAMMIAAMVAARINHGRVKLLKWNRETSAYITLTVEL